MIPKKYNEFKLVIRWENGKPEIESKTQTRRKQVSIHEFEAEIMNRNWLSTRMLYELAEEPKDDDKELREKLFEEAKELGLNVAKNITTEKLQEKINKHKEQ